MFDQEKENWFKAEMDRLVQEHKKLDDNFNAHHTEWSFEGFENNLDKRTEIIKRMSQLDTDHKQFLLDQLDKAGVETIQKIINYIFGIRA